MFLFEAVLSHSQVTLFKTDVLVVFFHHGLSRQAGLSSVHLTTYISDGLHTQSLQSKVILNRRKETGDFGWQANTFNVVSQQLPTLCLKVVWICSRKVIEVGFAQGLAVLTSRWESLFYFYPVLNCGPGQRSQYSDSLRAGRSRD
jgi:hypothetical protein